MCDISHHTTKLQLHFKINNYYIFPSGTSTEGIPTGNCSCGGFPSVTLAADSAPLLSQMPGLVVKCDDEGQTTCKSLCNALATATKAKGPEILCNKLKEANELKVFFYVYFCHLYILIAV